MSGLSGKFVQPAADLPANWWVDAYEQTPMFVPAGWKLWVAIIATPDVLHVATSDKDVEDWLGVKGATFTFAADAIVVVEGGSRGGHSCRHLRFARAMREGAYWPGCEIQLLRDLPLRRGCRALGLPVLYSPGEFQPVGFGDEFAVADFSVSGTRGWIVPTERLAEVHAAGLVGATWTNPHPIPVVRPAVF